MVHVVDDLIRWIKSNSERAAEGRVEAAARAGVGALALASFRKLCGINPHCFDVLRSDNFLFRRNRIR